MVSVITLLVKAPESAPPIELGQDIQVKCMPQSRECRGLAWLNSLSSVDYARNGLLVDYYETD